MKRDMKFFHLFIFCKMNHPVIETSINTDSIPDEMSHHPSGIKLDYFMDEVRYENPKHPLMQALFKSGVKYLHNMIRVVGEIVSLISILLNHRRLIFSIRNPGYAVESLILSNKL
jgi:hypothetical protein